MIPEVEVIKILNHNGANRRYSKEQARLIVNFLKPIADEFAKKLMESRLSNIGITITDLKKQAK